MFIKGMTLQPLAAVDTPKIRYDRPREVQCMQLVVYDHLRRVGILQRRHAVTLREGLHKRGYLRCHVIETCHDGIQLRGRDERLVSLYVYHAVELRPLLAVGLITTVRAAAMLVRGHNHTSAKGLHGLGYTLIVRSHDRVGHYGRDPFVDTTYDGHASQHGQRLALETRRRISRRYYRYESHIMPYTAGAAASRTHPRHGRAARFTSSTPDQALRICSSHSGTSDPLCNPALSPRYPYGYPRTV